MTAAVTADELLVAMKLLAVARRVWSDKVISVHVSDGVVWVSLQHNAVASLVQLQLLEAELGATSVLIATDGTRPLFGFLVSGARAAEQFGRLTT